MLYRFIEFSVLWSRRVRCRRAERSIVIGFSLLQCDHFPLVWLSTLSSSIGCHWRAFPRPLPHKAAGTRVVCGAWCGVGWGIQFPPGRPFRRPSHVCCVMWGGMRNLLPPGSSIPSHLPCVVRDVGWDEEPPSPPCLHKEPSTPRAVHFVVPPMCGVQYGVGWGTAFPSMSP